MRVSHIRWSATVTKIYTKQRQKKPVRSQLRVSNELWGHEGDIVPRPAHLQPWWAPQSTHTVCRKSPGTGQGPVSLLQHAELGMCTKSTLEMDWAGGEGIAAPASASLSQTEVDHIQGTIGNKEMLLPFRGCYNSPRCALTGSYLKIEDPGVLIIVRIEKELPLVWTKAGGWREYGAALSRISGCWRMKGWTWPRSVSLQPRNPRASWAPSKDSYFSHDFK